MKTQYSPSEFCKNIYYYIATKLTLKEARFIRRPVYIRGAGSLQGGKNLTTGRFCRFDLEGTKTTLNIGDNCEFGDFTHIVAHENVRIGDNVLIASKCFISDTSHGTYSGDNQDSPYTAPNQRKLITNPVRIGNNVWIGENAVILAGSEIGDGCIIGANSLVSKKIPANSIVINNGEIIKQYNDELREWEEVSK